MRLRPVAESCRELVISECRGIASQTRAQHREDTTRPARDSSVSSVRSSGRHSVLFQQSPRSALSLVPQDRHGGFRDTWLGTLSGGTDLSHRHRWDAVSRSSAREAGRPCLHLCSFPHLLNSELGSRSWGKTRGVTVIRESLDGPRFFRDWLREEESSPAFLPV